MSALTCKPQLEQNQPMLGARFTMNMCDKPKKQWVKQTLFQMFLSVPWQQAKQRLLPSEKQWHPKCRDLEFAKTIS